ncbi:uncharacterized protein LOC118761139 [Octopus sinensis]|uniref:Uncharacterized protein LOC118761139 n=1 Tax=Octopus sinensis TaxID=2607531 RepID=A0A7E6EHJ5_9MOLL|nr:uncharacterized protein LOC118761139 [Octopus sinensis]
MTQQHKLTKNSQTSLKVDKNVNGRCSANKSSGESHNGTNKLRDSRRTGRQQLIKNIVDKFNSEKRLNVNKIMYDEFESVQSTFIHSPPDKCICRSNSILLWKKIGELESSCFRVSQDGIIPRIKCFALNIRLLRPTEATFEDVVSQLENFFDEIEKIVKEIKIIEIQCWSTDDRLFKSSIQSIKREILEEQSSLNSQPREIRR